MNNIHKILILFGFILLTACASSGKDADKNAQNGAVGEEGSYAEGAGDQGSSFTSEDARCRPAEVKEGTTQRVFFDFDKFEVKPEFEKAMQVQAEYLTANPSKKIRLDGNTDDRGSREYNIGLGWKRAKAVASYLEQYGVVKEQINTVSYGAEKPVAMGTTEEDYACNRRVDFLYE